MSEEIPSDEDVESVVRVANGLIADCGQYTALVSAVNMLGEASTEKSKAFWYAVIKHIEEI